MTDTIKISPVRVFHCPNCKRMMGREHVWKDHNGDYHCKNCGSIPIEKTNTDTGKSFIQVTNL